MTSLSRSASFALVVLGLACGARTNLGGDRGLSDDAGAPFPVGTYTRCALGTVTSGPFLIPSGFYDGATLTVTGSGDARTATFDDGSGRSWSFTTTTSASAVLAPSAQTTSGFGSSICVYGLGVSNEKFFPTDFLTSSGAMTYQSGTVFVALEGELTSHTDCGDISALASTWLACTGGPAPDVSAPAFAAPFPIGDYACTSQIGTRTTLDGKNAFITSGGTGALTLTQAGVHVTAQYTDAELDGTLDLTLDAASTGTVTSGQTLTARCALDPTTDALSITAASLTANDGVVFLSFAGATSASGVCPGTEKIAALVCTKS